MQSFSNEERQYAQCFLEYDKRSTLDQLQMGKTVDEWCEAYSRERNYQRFVDLLKAESGREYTIDKIRNVREGYIFWRDVMRIPGLSSAQFDKLSPSTWTTLSRCQAGLETTEKMEVVKKLFEQKKKQGDNSAPSIRDIRRGIKKKVEEKKNIPFEKDLLTTEKPKIGIPTDNKSEMKVHPLDLLQQAQQNLNSVLQTTKVKGAESPFTRGEPAQYYDACDDIVRTANELKSELQKMFQTADHSTREIVAAVAETGAEKIAELVAQTK